MVCGDFVFVCVCVCLCGEGGGYGLVWGGVGESGVGS